MTDSVGALLLILGILLLAPIVMFLWLGLPARKREVRSVLNDDTVNIYFTKFHPEVPNNERSLERFDKLYDKLSGRRTFVFPFLILIGGCLVALLFVRQAESLFTRFVDLPANDGSLTSVAISAGLGAYFWVLYGFIMQYLRQSLTPRDLLWAGFRFAIATPLSFAVAASLQSALAVPTAFLLGAFPTHTLGKMARRLASTQVGLADEKGRESELQSLQSLDREAAERLSDLDVRTVLELAYRDPVTLTVQSSFAFSVVVDWVSQALLWLYLEDNLNAVRKLGVRGAQEVVTLWDDLNENDDSRSAKEKRRLRETAEKTVAAVAEVLQTDEAAVRHLLGQVAEDPYSKFLAAVWEPDSDNSGT